MVLRSPGVNWQITSDSRQKTATAVVRPPGRLTTGQATWPTFDTPQAADHRLDSGYRYNRASRTRARRRTPPVALRTTPLRPHQTTSGKPPSYRNASVLV
ncbi:trehalase-like domain-containing protein [Saccharothrix algeriensis]|uniref:trehalase-like domain-containing protein n=1 Tax=Saccharothrix algeriensis TaxID=173560 RepID=UPI001EF75CC1